MQMFLSMDELNKLTTKRLLAYKNKIMKYSRLPFWQETIDMIKLILSTREHIDK
jgi:hypothetical protein